MHKLDWISSELENNREKLEDLSQRLAKFYSMKLAYYDYIQDFGDIWSYSNYLPCDRIRNSLQKAGKVLELGCGRANILNENVLYSEKYCGVEFSNEIIQDNRRRFPNATFKQITNPYLYDFEDGQFDLVFSVFVIEHTVFPNLFLDECSRLLKRGGKLIILAPNFLDNNWVVSQRVASNLKSGKENLKHGRFVDAIMSLLYRKLLIPRKCQQIRRSPNKFWINSDPACFYYNETIPDLDATYITSFYEIENYLEGAQFDIVRNSDDLKDFIKTRRLGFIEATKK